MELVNVLTTVPMGDEFLQQIKAVNSQIKLSDISDLVAAEQRGDFSRQQERT